MPQPITPNVPNCGPASFLDDVSYPGAGVVSEMGLIEHLVVTMPVEHLQQATHCFSPAAYWEHRKLGLDHHAALRAGPCQCDGYLLLGTCGCWPEPAKTLWEHLKER
jgi:hypothetical protein